MVFRRKRRSYGDLILFCSAIFGVLLTFWFLRNEQYLGIIIGVFVIPSLLCFGNGLRLWIVYYRFGSHFDEIRFHPEGIFLINLKTQQEFAFVDPNSFDDFAIYYEEYGRHIDFQIKFFLKGIHIDTFQMDDYIAIYPVNDLFGDDEKYTSISGRDEKNRITEYMKKIYNIPND